MLFIVGVQRVVAARATAVPRMLHRATSYHRRAWLLPCGAWTHLPRAQPWGAARGDCDGSAQRTGEC